MGTLDISVHHACRGKDLSIIREEFCREDILPRYEPWAVRFVAASAQSWMPERFQFDVNAAKGAEYHFMERSSLVASGAPPPAARGN